jgi:hypothetical protein
MSLQVISASGGVLSQLGPTFALATKILTHEAVAKPWIHAMLGEETWDEEMQVKYLRETEEENDPEAYALFQAELRKLKVKFVFAAITEKQNGQIHAFHLLPGEPSDWFRLREGTDFEALEALRRDNHTIVINAAYKEYFLQDKATRDPVEDLITSNSLAMTIVHEIFHAWAARDRVYPPDYVEPYLDLNNARTASTPEFGIALELALFGIPMHTSLYPDVGAHVLCQHTPVKRSGTTVASIESHWCCLVNIR